MNRSLPTPPTILTFGGHDPSGGAGIQADIETISALGGHAATIITALTTQDSGKVYNFYPVDSAILTEQAQLIFNDFNVSAVKIGMVGSIEICHAIHTIMLEYPEIPIVLDPVLSGGGGGTLSETELAHAIAEKLAPLATLITPNRKELLKLGTTKELITAGTKNILVTGTDHPQPDEDSSLVHHLLTERNGATSSFTDQRLPYTYHGSGCTLAAATACGLAFDKDIGEAIRDGLEYSWRSLKNGFKPGAGQHFPRRIQHKHLK